MAEIKFSCPGCKVTLKVSDTLAGKKIRCPKCSGIAPIPATSTVTAPTAPSAPSTARPAAPAVPPPSPIAAVPVAHPSPSKSVPIAQPVAPPRQLSAIQPPPVEEPDFPFSSGAEDENGPDDAVLTPPPKPAKSGKKRKTKTPVLVYFLVALYVIGLVLVYFGVLLPIPEPIKVPEAPKAENSKLPADGAQPRVVRLIDLPPRDEAVEARLLADRDRRLRAAAEAEQKLLDEMAKTEVARNRSSALLTTFAESPEPIRRIAFSPASDTMAVVQGEKNIRLWDLRTWSEPRTLTGHEGLVNGIVFSPDGASLASAGAEGAVHLWDVKTGELIRTLQKGGVEVRCVAFSPDGSLLVAGGRGGKEGTEAVRAWDPKTGSPLDRFDIRAEAIDVVTFGLDGRLLITADAAAIRLWETKTGHQYNLVFPVGKQVRSLALGSDGRTMVVSGVKPNDKQFLSYCSLDTGEVREFLYDDLTIDSVALSPDASTLATAATHARGGSVTLWEVKAARELRQDDWKAPERPTEGAFSPGGKLLATVVAGKNGSLIVLWVVADLLGDKPPVVP